MPVIYNPSSKAGRESPYGMILLSVLFVTLSIAPAGLSPARANSPSQKEEPRAEGPEVWLCAHGSIQQLTAPEAEWPFVKEHLDGIKLYIGQLRTNRRRGTGPTREELQRFAQFVRDNQLQVAVELGGCLEFSPLDSQAGEWSARSELAAIENYYAAGGKVDFLDIDGPIRRLMHPKNRQDGKRFESIDEAADELIDALRIHRAAHPETQYWLLTNFPNWGWRGDVSYHARGPQRQDYGDYDTVVRTALKKLRAAEIPLNGVTVDNPYDYLIGEHHSVKIADPKSVDWLGRVRSYEDFARKEGLSFNLIVNSQRGGHESPERFCKETLEMVDTYRGAGGRPTRWIVQSWYEHPKKLVPETQPDTLTALVKEIVERVKDDGARSDAELQRE